MVLITHAPLADPLEVFAFISAYTFRCWMTRRDETPRPTFRELVRAVDGQLETAWSGLWRCDGCLGSMRD